MVLMHPVGSTWRIWEPVLPALEARFDIIALDLPGFGESPPLPEAPTVPALAEAVAGEMDRLGIATAHLVGNSTGGWVAAELAKAGRARTLTAISPAGMATRGEQRFESASMLVSRLLAQALAPVVGPLSRFPPMRLLGSQMFARPRRIPADQAAHATRAYARSPSFNAVRRYITSHNAEGLDAIGCPVTIVWGTKDRLLRPRQAQRWVDAIPGARLVELEGLGHAPMSDDPDVVAKTIIESATSGRPGAG